MITVALIPTYQPREELIELLDRLIGEGVDPVVIDDGSGTDYAHILACARERATVIGYDENLGKGHALKFGLDYVASCFGDDTVVVTVDGDGQHTAVDAARCAREAAVNPGSLVLGCRDFDVAGVPTRSRVGNVITRGIYRLASGVALRDTQTGLRAFTVGLIDFLVGVSGDRYEWEMNVLLACPANGITIREVPITTIYHDGNAVSHFRGVRDSARIYAGILSFAASSFVSFCIDYLLFAVLVTTVGATVANVAARIVSACVNFVLNRGFVFRSRESLGVTASRYALAAVGILLGNTAVVTVLVGVFHMAALPAKLVVELGFFLCSWVLQSRFVFPRKEIVYAY